MLYILMLRAVKLHQHLARAVLFISNLDHHNLINQFSYCIYWLHIVHLTSQQGSLGHSEKRKHLSRRKETLFVQLWHCCSEMPYRLLTHTNRHLHKVSCSASVAFRDATVNCLFTVFNQSLCPFARPLILTAALWLPPSVHQPPPPFSSFIISHRQHFSVSHSTDITPLVFFCLSFGHLNAHKYASKVHYSQVRVSPYWCLKSCLSGHVEL